MSWKQWTAVGLVIGFGILLQIPGHDSMEMDHGGQGLMESTTMTSVEELGGPYRMISLDVTGMT